MDRDIDQLAGDFRVLIESLQPRPEDLNKAGDWLVDQIRDRTLSGRDFNNGGFAPYSPQYTFTKGTSTVNLYGTSKSSRDAVRMLDQVQYKSQVEDAVGSESATSSLEVGIFDNEKAATEAKAHNEGAVFRTQLGMGLEGFKRNPGRRQTKGKSIAEIPQRQWLGASDADLEHIKEIVVGSIEERTGGA